MGAGSDPKQVEWARSFVAMLEDLRKYVMQHHTTGLTWNPKVSMEPRPLCPQAQNRS